MPKVPLNGVDLEVGRPDIPRVALKREVPEHTPGRSAEVEISAADKTIGERGERFPIISIPAEPVCEMVVTEVIPRFEHSGSGAGSRRIRALKSRSCPRHQS